MKKKIYFYIFLILSVIALFCTWIKFENKNYINVILETKIENSDDILLKIDNEYFHFKQFNNVLNQTIKKEIEKAEILINSKYKNEIEKIIVFNDIKMYSYQDFSEFEKADEKICFNNKCKIYAKYELKKEIIKPYKKKIYSFLNSMVRFDKAFFPFFILVILTVFCGCRLKINQFIAPICLLFLAFVIRLSDITQYQPWGDECYSILISNPNLPFLNLFNDPGNPPFYYFLLRIMQKFTDLAVNFRFLNVIISIIAGMVLYFFLNKNYSKKIANIALFLYAINLPLIYFSQEIRCYSLQVLLAILFLNYTFEILKNSNKKNWLIYLILSIVAVNTHYYQILFIVSNFIYLAFNFVKNKRKKDLYWLLGVNFIAILAFLPYFLLTSLSKAFLDISFNTYLPQISFELIKKSIYFVFGGLIPLCLAVGFLFKKFDEREKELCFYCFWTIFFIAFLAIVLSLIIRPMFTPHYLLFLIPLAIVILSFAFGFQYKNKFIAVFFILVIFLMQNYSKNCFVNFRKNNSQSYNLFKLAQEYKKQTNKEVMLILKASDVPTVKLNKIKGFKFKILNHLNNYKISNNEIEKIKQENKNTAIFTLLFDFKNAQNSLKDYACYYNSALDICVWKIE